MKRQHTTGDSIYNYTPEETQELVQESMRIATELNDNPDWFPIIFQNTIALLSQKTVTVRVSSIVPPSIRG